MDSAAQFASKGDFPEFTKFLDTYFALSFRKRRHLEAHFQALNSFVSNDKAMAAHLRVMQALGPML